MGAGHARNTLHAACILLPGAVRHVLSTSLKVRAPTFPSSALPPSRSPSLPSHAQKHFLRLDKAEAEKAEAEKAEAEGREASQKPPAAQANKRKSRFSKEGDGSQVRGQQGQ